MDLKNNYIYLRLKKLLELCNLTNKFEITIDEYNHVVCDIDSGICIVVFPTGVESSSFPQKIHDNSDIIINELSISNIIKCLEDTKEIFSDLNRNTDIKVEKNTPLDPIIKFKSGGVITNHKERNIYLNIQYKILYDCLIKIDRKGKIKKYLENE